MSEPKLIKIDRNGSKHYEGLVKCDRCGGDGIYKWGAVINGRPQYAGTCFKCLGAGTVIDTWIERTPEYEAKLAAKRAEKAAARQAEYAAINAKREEERKAREEERKAREDAIKAAKAVSQYVGTVGDRIDIQCEFATRTCFERRGFGYRGIPETVNVFHFRDDAGNLLVWKTTADVPSDVGTGCRVHLIGTIKEHAEYRDEKQTVLQRCKISRLPA